MTARRRCGWARATNPLYVAYHDGEWGVPVHDDQRLFEMLILEGAQAGLSWETILNKRDAYRRAFARFDPRKVARFGVRQHAALLANAGIVRNRAKIEAATLNARCFLEVQEAFGSFDAYAWDFVGGRPRQGRWESLRELPSRTEISDALARDLKRRGFKFVGSTIVYAWMQACGLVNDHVQGCFRQRAVARMR